MSEASPRITACILARNEERRIEAALQSLAAWTDQIILIDNESEDNTVAIARRYTDHILTAPRNQGLGSGGPGPGSAAPAPENPNPIHGPAAPKTGCGASDVPEPAPAPRYTASDIPEPTPQTPGHGPETLHPAPRTQPAGPETPAPNPQRPTLNAPGSANFDAARNLAIAHATGDFIFYLDADERVPPRLGEALRRLVAEQGDQFEALVIPFKHYFCGKWMEHSGWWPGYTRPQLLKKGRFRYNERLHSGVEVDGRTRVFPADDPELAIVHYSYDHLHHYLEKLNRYTDGEAESLLADGASHSWQAQLAHFVHDWQQYYERGRADLDGMHGFVLAFMSAFYRFAARAKLWDLRRQGEPGNRINTNTPRRAPGRHEDDTEQVLEGCTAGRQEPVPADLREMLEFMARVVQEGAAQWIDPPQKTFVSSRLRVNPEISAPLHWHAPLWDPSGYADEARNFLLGLLDAGEPVVVTPAVWAPEEAGLSAPVRERLESHVQPLDTPAELFVSHTLPLLQQPSPQARFNVARTMFETDRLPDGFAERLNRMDRIWVPSEFNRETFVRSGVDPAKLAVVPGAIDPAPFAAAVDPWPVPGTERFRFLALFDWTLHKGWDVLLEAFAREFGAHPDVGLVLKVWSTNGYTLDHIRAQADAHLRARLGVAPSEPAKAGFVTADPHFNGGDTNGTPHTHVTLTGYPNIHLWEERIPQEAMPRLYRAVNAFVLPTRGEGWCRPLMEAMAAGLPTIATAWSGLTAFHNGQVGYALKYQLVPVSEAGGREIPLYAGHCWAEPDRDDLQRLLRRVVEHPAEARQKGQAARKVITQRYSRAAVTRILQTELAHCRELAAMRDDLPAPSQPKFQNPEPEIPIAGTLSAQSKIQNPEPENPITRPLPAQSKIQNPKSKIDPPLKPNAHPIPREPAAPVDFRAALGRPLRVCWEGDQSLLSSLALVNREFCLGLLAGGDVELTLAEARTPWHQLTGREDPRFGPLFARRDAPLSGPPDVTIRHQFPPDWRRPESGKLIVIQPWEYGHLPQEWVAAARDQADEVWAYSRFVRDVYVRSGVPAEKVRVVPLGFNPAVFHREGPRYPLSTEKSLRFLFVGGALDRKGADLLLAAYQRAFTAADDVCLVVKDMGTRTFYQGQTFAEAFRQAQADSHGPQVIYLEDDLSETELASLYRACTCVVLPYRGEGFGLAPLEGMACGLPAIVTAGGPTDDYLDDTMALRVPCRRRERGSPQVGPFACAGDPWQLEPDLQALIDALHWVRDHPAETRGRGEAARTHVTAAWTWTHAVADARARLLTLTAPPSEQPVASARLWSEPKGHQHEDAKTRRRMKRNRDTTRSNPGTSKSSSDLFVSSCLRVENPVELSLCMIARDEAARIGQCLKSIAPHVDEMIVVDTGSRDRTREIARSCGARVFEFPWTDSFAEARNQSIEQARGNWIFWMDADDVISPRCGQELRRLIRRHPDRDAAFQAMVRIPPGPGEFSESIVDHVKLFPNRPDLRFEHRIHEQILPSIRRAGLPVLFSDVFVTHQNYDRSKAGQARKRRRDFHLLERDLRDRPDHPFTLFNLGMTHLYATHEYEVAAQYLQRSLAHSDPQDSIVRKAFAMLVTARLAQGEWAAALAANEAGRRHYPDDAELLFQAGQIYEQAGHWEEARACLERLTAGRDDPHYRSVDTGLRTYRGRHELALLFRRMGDAPHCERVLREIVAHQPGYLPAQIDLVGTLHGLGKQDEARHLLAQIPSRETIQDDLHTLRELVQA